jgi:hypothetical protein
MTAIRAGVITPSTKAALEEAEAERALLLQALQPKALDKASTFVPNLVEKFKILVDDIVTSTQHQVDKARGILRDLVGGEIVLHRAADGTERFLTAQVAGDYVGLMQLVMGPKINLVAVTRMENFFGPARQIILQRHMRREQSCELHA